jgi:hypothetical protein
VRPAALQDRALLVDSGSAHRGPRAARRLQAKYPNLALVHGPIHASWLNLVEIYFSILQRKALTPNDFSSLQELAQRLLAFERHYQPLPNLSSGGSHERISLRGFTSCTAP